jgi:hypothetical protein
MLQFEWTFNYAKWKKPDRKDLISYDYIYMICLNWLIHKDKVD